MGEEVYHISLCTSQMINVVRLIMIIGVIYVHTIPVLDTIDSPIITAFASLMRGPIGTSGIALFFFLSSILTYKKSLHLKAISERSAHRYFFLMWLLYHFGY